MKILEGRSTSIEIPIEYVQKIERYVELQSQYYLGQDKTGISGTVEQLIYINTLNKDSSFHYSEGGEKVYINQKVYREFIAKAKKQGYKNGLEYLKDIIDEKESFALQYGNDKIPEENPWAIEIGGKYINLAKDSGLAIAGDSLDNKEKVINYLTNQLADNRKGNETEVYQIDGEKTFHKTKDNPFEIDDGINTLDFLDWIEKLIEKRESFLDELDERRYKGLMPTIGVTGLNGNLPHSFSRVFIIIDSEKTTETIDKKINNLCRVNNEINGNKLYGMNIHLIVKISRDKFYEIVDGKAGNSYLNAMRGLIETDGQDIETGKEVAITTRKSVKREIVNTRGLFY
ncbi:hypothetical protein [Staphylococcus pseudoxylosus]|uniref:hypothetical protein n=1 Tax=Staphylococcus pseudoxylosus TaxID=2282419 RepID=UPI002DB94ACB|nr:hypothetical protein [Staphylococcus pseudoxylosus]MEB6038194.1 hypothetical protein [Staphylococcus pseudoxylosus]